MTDRVRKRRQPRSLIRLGLAGLILTGASACRPGGGADDPEAARTATVRSGDFQVIVTATGKVEANREVQVTSKASGEILEVLAEPGDQVRAGDLLVRLDPNNEDRSVRRNEANLRSATAKLEKARHELELARSEHQKSLTSAATAVELAETRAAEAEARYERQRQLFDQRLIAPQELELHATRRQEALTELTRERATLADTKNREFQILARQQDIELADVEVANARIALEEARERLADTEVRSPLDGTVTQRHVEPGWVISSAMSNISGGTLLMVVSDLSRLYVVAEVDEADIGGVRLGQSARISADAFPEASFEGEVAHLAPVGVEKSGVVIFDVKIEVLGEGRERLRPGMTADAAITTAESHDTHWVESAAIQRDDGGATFVEADDGDAPPRRVSVRVGIADGLFTEIVEGVQAGWRLLIPPTRTIGSLEREAAERPARRR